MINTAVFGGSFDPVHSEHVNIAKACVEELEISKLIIVPTFNPPYKDTAGAPFARRAEMLKLAFADFPAEVIVSDVETHNKGKNYSSENLPKLKETYGDFYYIIGGDSLWQFENWHEPEFIAKNFKIVVFNREGYEDVSDKVRELNKRWGVNIRVMEYGGKNVDSHTLRVKLNLGMYATGLPKAVEEYICVHRLYKNYADYLIKLPAYLSKQRLEHSRNTALMAALLNTRCNLGLSYDKIIKAGLLHDLGKKFDYDDKALLLYNIPKDSFNTPVQHQFISAEIARKDFKITDAEILDAIRYHTTGRTNMTLLDKLIYVADMVSTERVYPAVDSLREELYRDFEKGFKVCLMYSYKYLVDNKRNIYPLTLNAINFYKEQK